MRDFEIDFEWPVAKYEFRAPPTDEEVNTLLREGTLDLDEVDWGRLGTFIPISKAVKRRPSAATMDLAVDALVKDKYQNVPPHTFCKIVLKIVNAVGTINPWGDGVVTWLNLAKRLRLMFEGVGGKVHEEDDEVLLAASKGPFLPPPPPIKEFKWPHPRAQYKGDVGIYLVPGKDGTPVLAFRPRGLEEALVFYAARKITTGTTFNVCKHCKTSFLSGGSRGKKRSDARFCSDKCRYSYHNEANRKLRG